LFLYPAWYGALTPLWAATMPETIAYNGEVAYYALFCPTIADFSIFLFFFLFFIAVDLSS